MGQIEHEAMEREREQRIELEQACRAIRELEQKLEQLEDEIEAEKDAARQLGLAIQAMIRRCPFDCTEDGYCGACEIGLSAIKFGGLTGIEPVDGEEAVSPYVGRSMDRKRNARRRQLSGAHTAESWNADHPVGTRVQYWPVWPPVEGIAPLDTTTRSEAWALGDGSVVVLVVGKSGGVHLSHVEVVK